MRGPDHAWMLAVRKWSREEERMSKASEWAKQRSAECWAHGKKDRADIHAHILPTLTAGPLLPAPRLVIFRKADARLVLSADEALSLAEWIFDTFGEKP